jgi:hypothetical protein
MVQTGGGKTLVPMLFTLLRRDYPHLFPGNRRILAFSPTVALLWDMHRRFSSAGIRVWTPPRCEHAVKPGQDTDDVAAAATPCLKTLNDLPRYDVILVTSCSGTYQRTCRTARRALS